MIYPTEKLKNSVANDSTVPAPREQGSLEHLVRLITIHRSMIDSSTHYQQMSDKMINLIQLYIKLIDHMIPTPLALFLKKLQQNLDFAIILIRSIITSIK